MTRSRSSLPGSRSGRGRCKRTVVVRPVPCTENRCTTASVPWQYLLCGTCPSTSAHTHVLAHSQSPRTGRTHVLAKNNCVVPDHGSAQLLSIFVADDATATPPWPPKHRYSPASQLWTTLWSSVDKRWTDGGPILVITPNDKKQSQDHTPTSTGLNDKRAATTGVDSQFHRTYYYYLFLYRSVVRSRDVERRACLTRSWSPGVTCRSERLLSWQTRITAAPESSSK